jgi:hypothetical protein
MKGRGKAIEPIVAPSKKYKNSPPPTSWPAWVVIK